jgi:hypothetical protein
LVSACVVVIYIFTRSASSSSASLTRITTAGDIARGTNTSIQTDPDRIFWTVATTAHAEWESEDDANGRCSAHGIIQSFIRIEVARPDFSASSARRIGVAARLAGVGLAAAIERAIARHKG